MTDYNAEGAAIAAVLAQLTNPGVVFDHQPMPQGMSWADFVETFTVEIGGQRHVRAWTVQMVRDVRKPKTISQSATKIARETTWRVRAHLTWAGDSETTFRELVRDAVALLDKNRSMGGAFIDHDPCDVELPNDGAGVLLGDVLCHFAEIDFVSYTEDTINDTQ